MGDNISAKNPYYCELIAQYWGCRNLKADYIGLGALQAALRIGQG
jgi:hypothetical protein